MKKWAIVIGCVVIICGIFYWSSLSEKSIPHHNVLDMQISQYSDTHITSNAKTTNPEFKNIAFETSPSSKSSFFQNQIATVIKTLKFLTQTPQPGSKESGTWVWTPTMQLTSAYMDSTISQAKINGINTIYLSVDSYLDIFVMQKSTDKEKQNTLFEKKLEYFISHANKLGIKVDAEAGWRNWAEPENSYKAFAVADFVKNFNKTHENKFDGFQYDIEPYLLDSYKSDPTSVLKNFVKLVDDTQNFLSTSSLKFAVVVPDFYDKNDKITPEFSYDGKSDYTFGHLLSILDKRPDSSIIIMSYRSFATGHDGSIEISENEMKTAKAGNYQTKIIIAQETSEVLPQYITFYGTSKKRLSGEIMAINDAFNKYPNFNGIAIHYANAFLALK